MPTLSITKNYQDLQVLDEQDLDDAFDSVETFVNTTKLNDENIQAGGISTANLADQAVTAAKLAVGVAGSGLSGGGGSALSVNVDDSTIGISTDILSVKDAGITSAKIQSNVNLAGKAVQEDGKNVVVSNTNTTNSLAIIRGYVSSSGSINSGEGFSVSKPGGTGQYTITYSTAFGDTPAVTVTPLLADVTSGFSLIAAFDNTTCRIVFSSIATAADTDAAFCFTAIGQRA